MENISLNVQLLNWLYAGPNPQLFVLQFAIFAAKHLVWLFPLILVYQSLRKPRQLALPLTILITILISLSLSYSIGVLFPTLRPFIAGYTIAYIPHSADFSFPSDHACLAASMTFCYFLVKRYQLAITCLLLSLIIGWARVYVGIHYPLDILGGFIIGLLSALIGIKLVLPKSEAALILGKNKLKKFFFGA